MSQPLDWLKTTLSTTCLDHHMVIIRCYKIVLWRLLCLLFLLMYDVQPHHAFVFFVVLRVFCLVVCSDNVEVKTLLRPIDTERTHLVRPSSVGSDNKWSLNCLNASKSRLLRQDMMKLATTITVHNVASSMSCYIIHEQTQDMFR
jgi:hypothetical protein